MSYCDCEGFKYWYQTLFPFCLITIQYWYNYLYAWDRQRQLELKATDSNQYARCDLLVLAGMEGLGWYILVQLVLMSWSIPIPWYGAGTILFCQFLQPWCPVASRKPSFIWIDNLILYLLSFWSCNIFCSLILYFSLSNFPFLSMVYMVSVPSVYELMILGMIDSSAKVHNFSWTLIWELYYLDVSF